MTRIISGRFGGRRLSTPTGAATRPTTDRVRESLFSRLDHLGVLEDAVVIDLFAGSGALGLEALSRGAARAVLVEKASDAARVTRRNVTELGASAQVVVADAAAYLRRETDGPEYDLAFLDPPYDLGEQGLAEVLSHLAPRLHPDAVVVVERSSRSPEPSWPAALVGFASKTHGETALWYAEPAAPDHRAEAAAAAAGEGDPRAESETAQEA